MPDGTRVRLEPLGHRHAPTTGAEWPGCRAAPEERIRRSSGPAHPHPAGALTPGG
ncbi:hypothetical protein [Streptomyces sp. NE5-10]|uniref:hypothetical protein n=1 Tax=Streptomyces sp. NE5-10 TaxID=2759674 RepID=UPI001908E1DA|nr:hypothetical protein [Streptomyces sp. NE5-10]